MFKTICSNNRAYLLTLNKVTGVIQSNQEAKSLAGDGRKDDVPEDSLGTKWGGIVRELSIMFKTICSNNRAYLLTLNKVTGVIQSNQEAKSFDGDGRKDDVPEDSPTSN